MKNHFIKKLAGIIAALISISAVVLIATGTRTSAAVVVSDAKTLRLGYLPNVTSALALVGVNSGIFQKSLGKTELKTIVFNAGPSAVEALFAGSIDAAFLGPAPTITAFTRSKGEAIRIVSGAASGGAQLIVQSGITSAAQLVGKEIATPQLGGTQDVALRYWLKKNGLPAPITGGGKLNVIPEENATSLLLFQRKEIAGAWLPEPWASRLVLTAGGKVLVNERDLWPDGSFVTTNLIVSTSYLYAHPQTITKLLRGELLTLKVLTSDPAKAVVEVNRALTTLTGKELPENVLTRALQETQITIDPLARTLRSEALHSVAVGLSTSTKLSGIYDLSLLNTLLRKEGRPALSAAGLGKE
ncbi:MAG: ABC transporter substrate-binding protein [Actinobacteria bacterium]|nr:ABC transporter substrate-binding protein [Actinomycetota bacterium]